MQKREEKLKKLRHDQKDEERRLKEEQDKFTLKYQEKSLNGSLLGGTPSATINSPVFLIGCSSCKLFLQN